MLSNSEHKLIVAEFLINKNAATVLGTPNPKPWIESPK